MYHQVFWIALAIAVSGGCLGEWLRLRRRWAPGTAPCYWHAAVLCALIVTGNATLAGVMASEAPPSLSSLAIVLVVGGGPLLYATAWIVIITSWDYFQQTRTRGRARWKSRS
jgi:hypothetical protein